MQNLEIYFIILVSGKKTAINRKNNSNNSDGKGIFRFIKFSYRDSYEKFLMLHMRNWNIAENIIRNSFLLPMNLRFFKQQSISYLHFLLF